MLKICQTFIWISHARNFKIKGYQDYIFTKSINVNVIFIRT